MPTSGWLHSVQANMVTGPGQAEPGPTVGRVAGYNPLDFWKSAASWIFSHPGGLILTTSEEIGVDVDGKYLPLEHQNVVRFSLPGLWLRYKNQHAIPGGTIYSTFEVAMRRLLGLSKHPPGLTSFDQDLRLMRHNGGEKFVLRVHRAIVENMERERTVTAVVSPFARTRKVKWKEKIISQEIEAMAQELETMVHEEEG